jgi:hypothetical protein
MIKRVRNIISNFIFWLTALLFVLCCMTWVGNPDEMAINAYLHQKY